jgi:hypothetical protein
MIQFDSQEIFRQELRYLWTATEVFQNICRNKRSILAGKDYDLNICKISKCGKNRLFVVSYCSGQFGNGRL